MELLLRDGWQDAPLHADHGADEGVDENKQGELREILADSETGSLAHFQGVKRFNMRGKGIVSLT